MRRIQSLLMILISLWLPIQAAAAVTMPFCRHAPEQAVTAAAHCHEQAAEQVAPAKVGDLDCDNCTLCHLACTGFLLAAVSATPSPLTASILVPKLQPAMSSHIPEPPQQPPRR
ncbi:hypothetical protein [Sulfuricystis thermophila]|uniref:hypothetical protein n=1 Tax=Sulfuricystis thermophila TaxID=2496847 RepID=UPI001035B419|nr:hypothetical protein [Sulfuricystis thermophila]